MNGALLLMKTITMLPLLAVVRKCPKLVCKAVFGKPTMSALSNLNTESNEFESASTIFGLMLRHMMDDKIKGYGLSGATIGYREAVSACIFRQAYP